MTSVAFWNYDCKFCSAFIRMETSAKRVERALKVFGAFNAVFEDLNEGEKKEFMCKLSVDEAKLLDEAKSAVLSLLC